MSRNSRLTISLIICANLSNKRHTPYFPRLPIVASRIKTNYGITKFLEGKSMLLRLYATHNCVPQDKARARYFDDERYVHNLISDLGDLSVFQC